MYCYHLACCNCGLRTSVKNTVYYYIFQLSLLLLLNNYSCNCNNTISSVSVTDIAKNDKRSIISRNIHFICEIVDTKEADVIYGYKSHVYKREEMLSHE